MVYELWHTPSGNALSEHQTLGAALDAVREVLELDGDRAVRHLALLQVNKRGDAKMVAEGAGLLALIATRV